MSSELRVENGTAAVFSNHNVVALLTEHQKVYPNGGKSRFPFRSRFSPKDALILSREIIAVIEVSKNPHAIKTGDIFLRLIEEALDRRSYLVLE